MDTFVDLLYSYCISSSSIMSQKKTFTDPRLALYIAECKLRKSCEQIKLISRRLDLLQLRYDRAMRDDLKSFRYSLRLQLAATEGSKNKYYEYAVRQATAVARLKGQLKKSEKIKSVVTETPDQPELETL